MAIKFCTELKRIVDVLACKSSKSNHVQIKELKRWNKNRKICVIKEIKKGKIKIYLIFNIYN